MHEADLLPSRLVERPSGFRRWLQSDFASLLLEIVAGLGRQTHVAFLTGSNDQQIAALLIDKFGLLLRDDVRVAAGRAARASSESGCDRWQAERRRNQSRGMTSKFFPLHADDRRQRRAGLETEERDRGRDRQLEKVARPNQRPRRRNAA